VARRLPPARGQIRPIDLEHRDQRNPSPLELGLVELPTRPRSEYTMGVRREALEEADSGRLRGPADITRAAMTESGYARGILSDLTHGLWGLPRTFIGRADMIAELDDSPERIGQFRTMFPEPDSIRLMSWGITLGIGVGQMRHRYQTPSRDFAISLEESADGTWQLPAPTMRPTRPIGGFDVRTLRAWDPKYLRNQWWDDSWWLMTADGEIRIEPNDGEWILYTPYGEMKPWEYGAWRSLTLAFVLARDAMFDRSRHAEVLAPVRVGTVPQGTTERQRAKYAKLIKDMQRMGGFVLPPGLDYKIVESTGKVADIYAKIIEWAEREYAMITGAVITATGSAGFSKGDVQERFTRSILASFGASLSSCLYAGGLVPWAQTNFGADDAPRVEWDTTPPEDKKARAETIGLAGDSLGKLFAGAALAGVRPTRASVEAYIQGLGFAVETIPEEERKAARLEVAPADRAKPLLVDELRAGGGYAPIGDERGSLTLAELDALAKQKASGAQTPPTLGPGEPTPANDAPGPGDAPPTDESAMSLASKMSEYRIARCEHGSSNRCRLCGVERVRDFAVGKPGQPPKWLIAWRPIVARTLAASRDDELDDTADPVPS
jgi:hypothetical protein